MSLYMQAVAFLSIGHLMRTIRLEDIDFEVYRNGGGQDRPWLVTG